MCRIDSRKSAKDGYCVVIDTSGYYRCLIEMPKLQNAVARSADRLRKHYRGLLNDNGMLLAQELTLGKIANNSTAIAWHKVTLTVTARGLLLYELSLDDDYGWCLTLVCISTNMEDVICFNILPASRKATHLRYNVVTLMNTS